MGSQHSDTIAGSFFIKSIREYFCRVGNLYRFYIYLRNHFLYMFLSRAIISVLKELIHLIHGLQRKERRMLFLDYQDRRPIYEQIVEKFRMLILSGAVVSLFALAEALCARRVKIDLLSRGSEFEVSLSFFF